MAFDFIVLDQRRLIETFEKEIFKMNGLEELVQGNSVRWTKTLSRRRTKSSGEDVTCQLQAAKEKQASAAVLSPEMVMAEFDRQVGTIHPTTQTAEDKPLIS